MITGQITDDNKAIVMVRLRGAGGEEIEIEAILDTGFTDFLTLPSALIQELSWPWRDSTPIVLADGSRRRVDIHEGRVLWHGQWRTIPVQACESDPLLGMALLRGTFVSLEVVTFGNVTIEPIDPDE